ncbi:putative Mn2+ efflux pump MntP [Conyzicola lurida]|uniref:Putative manganese efflux pump MntP n=1 Tax=Conyzicola lurida TaxID=1172621 RepID=A0A841AID1_9MICO|nr:manganese efflux pump MntP family protein [Conyzicola lurida]MBB5841752.1 putative Mn2+ efflux pump MntP [Conyzicola lurida]
MALWSVFLIALGVSADAFAVSLGRGLHMRRLNYRHAFLIALTFGAFQALMPLIGWLLGTQLEQYITSVDHWITFGLLAIIGGKMLWEAFAKHEDKDETDDRLHVRQLLLLAVATSVDALAVGISFAFLSVSIGESIALIGVTTFVLSFVGVLIGHRVGLRFSKPAEIAGGVILILIGTKILLDHLGVWG